MYKRQSGLLLAQFIGILVASSLSLLVINLFSFRYSIEGMRYVAVKYKNAPKYLLPSNLVDIVTQQWPIILIFSFYSAEISRNLSAIERKYKNYWPLLRYNIY